MPLRGPAPSSPHSPDLTASGSRARLPGEPPASGSVLSLPSGDRESDLKLPAGGTTCQGEGGPRVTGNPDKDTGGWDHLPGHSQPVGQGAAGHQKPRRDTDVRASLRRRQWEPSRGSGSGSEGQQRACPHPGVTAMPSPRTATSSFLFPAHPWSVPRSCSKAIRTGTDQEAQDQDRVPMGRLDLEVCPGRVRAQTMEQGRGEGGRSSRKQSQHRRAGRGQDPSRARMGALTVGWQRPAV